MCVSWFRGDQVIIGGTGSSTFYLMPTAYVIVDLRMFSVYILLDSQRFVFQLKEDVRFEGVLESAA